MDIAYRLPAPTDDYLPATDTSDLPTTTNIYIERGRFIRSRGQTYTARLDSPTGAIIARDCLDVEYAACRALVAIGRSGRLLVWRTSKAHADMLIRDIAKAAKLTVVEGRTSGPRVGHYGPAPVELLRPRSVAA